MLGHATKVGNLTLIRVAILDPGRRRASCNPSYPAECEQFTQFLLKDGSTYPTCPPFSTRATRPTRPPFPSLLPTCLHHGLVLVHPPAPGDGRGEDAEGQLEAVREDLQRQDIDISLVDLWRGPICNSNILKLNRIGGLL